MHKILAILAASVSLAAIAPTTATAVANFGRSSDRCQEDQPCWNWATMGNKSRGIVTKHGTPLVVGPCRFRKLMNAGMIDYRASDVMRGDRTAMRMRSCPRPLTVQHY